MERTREEKMAVANEIILQLGGSRFRAMTGAHTFLAHDDGLSFKVPRTMTRNHINYVKISLNEMDLYTVFFGKIVKRKAGYAIDEVAVWSDVYNDGLQAAFSKETGLDTHL